MLCAQGTEGMTVSKAKTAGKDTMRQKEAYGGRLRSCISEHVKLEYHIANIHFVSGTQGELQKKTLNTILLLCGLVENTYMDKLFKAGPEKC